MIKRLYHIVLLLCLLALTACASREKEEQPSELRTFERFSALNGDSVSTHPYEVRAKAVQGMQASHDSLTWYNYLAMALKTYLVTSEMDSARLVVRQIEDFISRQPSSPQLADLASDCANSKGNIYVRTGYMDSAAACYRRAYELRMQSNHKESVPDILINLADACNQQGKLDVGAAWYRRALLLCDSLQLPDSHKYPIYYGLGQIYVWLRDFEQCDHYYNLAARYFDEMRPTEKHFYLNNRGTSYYYRGDYETALTYFRRVIDLTTEYPEMVFERNLTWLNLADCFISLQQPDSAALYINLCEPFFKEYGMPAALYAIDTQKMGLCLLRKDLEAARRVLASSVTSPDVYPDLIHVRNRNLQRYFEQTQNYHKAYDYLKKNRELDDSIRNEHVKMRTADLALRYQQDSTLMSQKVLIQAKENEVLELRQTRIIWIALCGAAFLVMVFIYMYSKKKRALLLVESRRTVSTLRLENIRNRLSPHFIFNVLNQEMAGRKEEEKHELASLVKLMRRNLELAEQLCVTLSEELDFVRTYIDLERRSLGDAFYPEISLAPDVHPEQVMLPSMLIQIPVENAVKHALRGKEGERRLWITVTRTANAISIKVTDNGGGYRPNSRNRGTGTGMKVIMQTIQILNMKNKETIDVSVHNVLLDSGETGCEVAFLLPDKYDYTI